MNLRKAITLFAVLLVSVVMLAACGGGDEEKESESASGAKTVKFMHLWPEGSSAQHYKVVNEIIADFEKENQTLR